MPKPYNQMPPNKEKYVKNNDASNDKNKMYIFNASQWDDSRSIKKLCNQNLADAQEIRLKILKIQYAGNAPTILNLYNKILIYIDRLTKVSDLIANVHPEKEVRLASENCHKKTEKFISSIKTDQKLYKIIKNVDAKMLDKITQRFIIKTIREYQRSGINKKKTIRDRLSDLKDKIDSLEQEFERNIRNDKRSIEVEKEDLVGLPNDFISLRVKEKKKTITITTDSPDLYPVLLYCKNEKIRKRLFIQDWSRGFPANESVLKNILKYRHEYATILGYTDWAAYQAEDKMVGSKDAIEHFIDQVAVLAKPRMEKDLSLLLKRKRKDLPHAADFQLWDNKYYNQIIKTEKFGVDPYKVRSYFEITLVKEGILKLAERLFGITIQLNPSKKGWHYKVEAYDVLEKGQLIGQFFLDLYPREGKYKHDAMFPMISGIKDIQIPSGAIVANFPEPSKAKNEPALMEHIQVVYFLHEFGHLMHHILAGKQRWLPQSGISCETDFWEVPSKLIEEWAWDPDVLITFARHFKTGAPIKRETVQRMNEAKDFGVGVDMRHSLFYAALSLKFHTEYSEKINLKEISKKLQKRYSPFPYIEGTSFYTRFGHLVWYDSNYYTYMWSTVIAKDLFEKFKTHGLFNDKVSLQYRKSILEPGGTIDARTMISNFLGRPFSFDSFRKWMTQ